MMRYLIIFVLSTPLVFLISACDKNKLTEFDINYSSTLTVPPSTYTINMPADYTTPQIPTQAASKFSAEKTGQSLISEITLTKLTISTTGGTLDALKSISIYIKAAGQSDALVATKTNIPPGSTSISADLTGVNIKSYIFMDNVQFRATLVISADSLPSQQLQMAETVHVKASLSK